MHDELAHPPPGYGRAAQCRNMSVTDPVACRRSTNLTDEHVKRSVHTWQLTP